MLSDAADLAQLAQLAPWLAVSLLALFAVGWVYRQSRRQLAAAEERQRESNRRQGERIGELEQTVGLLDLRRRQVEWVLLDEGLELPYWPPDGPQQPRARRRDVDEDQDDAGPRTAAAPYLPVPPLPEGIAARHRRDAAPA